MATLLLGGCSSGEPQDGSASTSEMCAAQRGNAYQEVETRCDSIDNDCDGLRDVLLPVSANECSEATARCGVGYAACRDGERHCLVRGPSSEVVDEHDNDCDAEIDEASGVDVRARALLLAPAYLFRGEEGIVDTMAATLDQWGVPYDRPHSEDAFEAALEGLPDYPLVVVVGYLVDAYLSPHRQEALEKYAAGGGTLVVFNPIFDDGSAAHELLGTRSTQRRTDVDAIVFEDTPSIATRVFDSPEERRVPVDNAASEDVVPRVHVLTPASAETLATARVKGNVVGAAVTRRNVGKGRIYALGHDLHRFFHARCYVNCFEPSGDLAGLFLRAAFRKAMQGHVVLKHTVPGPQDSLVILSHDVDARDAQQAGPWGEPGAYQVAALEEAHGARGSFLVQTDYLSGQFAPELMQRLCDLGMCPRGAHSVVHSNDFDTQPRGDCDASRATYDPERAPSLCGEVHVSMSLLEEAVGKRPLVWRSPFLLIHPSLYEVLAEQGILMDSTYAVGDLKHNLPLSLARVGFNQHVFHRQPLYTMPVALEDGMGEVVDGSVVRHELSADNAETFLSTWTYAMLRNADNGAHTMLLLHPSFGLDVPEDNLRHKLSVLERFIEASRERGVKLDATMTDIARFWRAREQVAVEARYVDGVYTGILRVGDHSVRDFTLEFGDAIDAFRCDTCGAAEIAGKRVVLRDELESHSEHMFEAPVGLR